MSTLPKIVSDLTVQLATAIAVSGTTATISANVDDDGVTLVDGFYYFTLDGSNSNKEHISCTKTGTVLTAIKSVSRQAVETSGVVRAHRVGCSVVMTDFATYKSYIDNTALQGVANATPSVFGVVETTTTTATVVSTDDTRMPSANPTTLFAPITQGGVPTGSPIPYAGRTAPAGYLLCDGSAVSRSTYAALLAAIAPSQTFTVTIASPGVFTKTAHGLITGDQLHLTTTIAMPTGLTTNTNYYVSKKDANSFWVFDTKAHAFSDNGGGSGTGIVVTTGSQSGVHTLYASPWGKGDGSTTFNVPDFRGVTPYGQKTTDANFDALNVPNTYVGEKTHVLSIAELAAHTHTTGLTVNGGSTSTSTIQGTLNNGTNVTGSTGSDTAHNNMPPYVVLTYIIKT